MQRVAQSEARDARRCKGQREASDVTDAEHEQRGDAREASLGQREDKNQDFSVGLPELLL